MSIKATQNCIIVRPERVSHEIFALVGDDFSGTGIVVAVGPDATEVKVGDKVLFADDVGTPVRWNGKLLLVMRESHTLGVFDK